MIAALEKVAEAAQEQMDVRAEYRDDERLLDALGELAALPRRPVVYVAGPSTNQPRVRRWLRYLAIETPGVTYIAPWLTHIELFDDSDPAQREAGLLACEAVLARCDALVLVGGRLSPGMARESRAAVAMGIEVIDWTNVGDEPPGEEKRVACSECGGGGYVHARWCTEGKRLHSAPVPRAPDEGP